MPPACNGIEKTTWLRWSLSPNANQGVLFLFYFVISEFDEIVEGEVKEKEEYEDEYFCTFFSSVTDKLMQPWRKVPKATTCCSPPSMAISSAYRHIFDVLLIFTKKSLLKGLIVCFTPICMEEGIYLVIVLLWLVVYLFSCMRCIHFHSWCFFLRILLYGWRFILMFS